MFCVVWLLLVLLVIFGEVLHYLLRIAAWRKSEFRAHHRLKLLLGIFQPVENHSETKIG